MGIWESDRISPRFAGVEREDESEGNTSPSGGDRPAGSRRPPDVICHSRTPLPTGAPQEPMPQHGRDPDHPHPDARERHHHLGPVRLQARRRAPARGLFECTGGGAVDYGFLNERLWVTLEAYDFSRADDLDPHLRLTGRWWLTPNLFLTGG